MAAYKLLSNLVRLSPQRRIEDSVSNFHSLTTCGKPPFWNTLRAVTGDRVRMVRVNAMNGFFNRLLDCRLLLNLKTVAEVLNDGGGFPVLRGR